MPERAFELIPHMVLRCDVNGNVMSVNSKWINFTGLTLEQTQVDGWTSVVHPSEIESAQAAWEKCVVLQEPFTIDLRMRKASSSEYKWHRADSTFGIIQDEIMCITTFTDINTEKLLTKAQYDSMRKDEALSRRVRHATDPILTVNGSDQTIITFNRAAEKNFGYTQEEIIGKPYTILMSEAAAKRHAGPDGYLARHQRTAIHGHAMAIGTSKQVYAKKKSGEMIPITLIVDSYTKGSQHFYIVVLRIVTPELNVQKELHNSKDAFLSTMSHELRTPLFGLLGILSLLPPMPDGVLQEEMRNMEVCVLNMLSIVNNMIDFYLLEHLRTTPNIVPFQMGLLLNETCSKLEGYVNPGVQFDYSVDGDMPFLVSDRKFLDHIISNLLSNAMRFTHKGHVSVSVGLADESTKKTSGLEVSAGQTMLRISVQDTGIGIDPAFYPEMFKPFCQVDASDSRQYGGVGLGLAVTKCLVDLLGGIITYKSTMGQGTEFTVLIPVDFIEGIASPPIKRPPPRNQYEDILNESLPHSPSQTASEIPRPTPPQSPHHPQPPPVAPAKLKLSPIFQHPAKGDSFSGCPFRRNSMLQVEVPREDSELPNPASPLSPEDPCQISREVPKHAPVLPPPSPFVNKAALLPPFPPDFSLTHDRKKSIHLDLTQTQDLNQDLDHEDLNLTQDFTQTQEDHPKDHHKEDSAKDIAKEIERELSKDLPRPRSSSPAQVFIPSGHPPISQADGLRRSCPIFVHPQMSQEFGRGHRTPPVSPKTILEAAEKLSRSPRSPGSYPPHPFPTISPRSSFTNLPSFPTLPVPATPKRFAANPPNVQVLEEMKTLNFNVLVVEDNAMNQMVIKKMLDRIGCKAVVAKHGKQALDILFNEQSKDYIGYKKFDLVLMDCQMPVMDGFQATREIRNWEKENVLKETLKVLALTASSSLDNEKECYRSGMDGFIAKPITVQGLYQYIA